MKRKKGFFSISAVAKMFSVHQQTIRLYEKEGLIAPKRSSGNTRLFSEEDVDRLEEIIYLTHQLGINLAGVEMILKLKKQIDKMQKDMNKLFDQTQKDLTEQVQQAHTTAASSARSLLRMKKNTDQEKLPSSSKPEQHRTMLKAPAREPLGIEEENDSWEIEYDE